MFDPSVIFQRTHTGREEIRQKQYGLTQSERLVLIMVDGVATYSEVRSKLPVLTDERFKRAIKTLQQKELIVEVLLPMEGQEPDEIEKTVIDRFLQQDPLDPVTILLHDPDELGIPAAPTPPKKPQASGHSDAPQIRQTAIDDAYIQLADSLAEELKALQEERGGRSTPSTEAQAPWAPKPEPAREPIRRPAPALPESSVQPGSFLRIHWGYWLIAAGLAFIAGYFVARLTA